MAPAELEGCILGHSMVADVCVVGMPDSFSGEVPLAFVIPTKDVSSTFQTDPHAISQVKASIMEVCISSHKCCEWMRAHRKRKYVAKLKSPYKHLHRVELVEEIPKNSSGKLLRRILRERARQLVSHPAKL